MTQSEGGLLGKAWAEAEQQAQRAEKAEARLAEVEAEPTDEQIERAAETVARYQREQLRLWSGIDEADERTLMPWCRSVARAVIAAYREAD